MTFQVITKIYWRKLEGQLWKLNVSEFLALEVHKALNNLSPTYIKDFFLKKMSVSSRQNVLNFN